jgi:NADP-dependent 3-hydroxy acid dehydrogenase YdfG
MTDNTTGKDIVITRASTGMGEAAARDLAAKGARVVLGLRDTHRLESILQGITEPLTVGF